MIRHITSNPVEKDVISTHNSSNLDVQPKTAKCSLYTTVGSSASEHLAVLHMLTVK